MQSNEGDVMPVLNILVASVMSPPWLPFHLFKNVFGNEVIWPFVNVEDEDITDLISLFFLI